MDLTRDIVCDVVNQEFAWDFKHNAPVSINLTQNDERPLRLYMVQPSRYQGSGHPFYFSAASGDEDYTCIVSIRDVTSDPTTLASTAPMTAIVNGFEGVLPLNTEEVAAFLSGSSEKSAAFCIDLINGSGQQISPFRRSINLRATDSGSVTQVPGIIYDPDITGLTGGGSTKLDGITTTTKAVGSLQILTRQISGAWSQSTWKLIAGTTAEDEDAGVVRPDDYNASTNAKIWVRVDGL